MAEGKARRDGLTGAQNLRTKHRIALDAPLDDILDLAEKRCGVPVAVLPRLGGDLAGAYVKDKSRCVILVNAEDPAPRMRFTLAHELGHHYFHHLERVPQLSGWGQITDTREEIRHAHDWWEVQANAFAAELLIPRPAVERWWAERGDPHIGLDTVVDLACAFGTSALMACIRLQTAEILTDANWAARLRDEINAGEHQALADCQAPYEDGLGAARETAPRIPPALAGTRLAAMARGDRSPEEIARKLGAPVAAFTEAMRGLGLVPRA